jgi:hypothetical protein
MVVLMEWSYGVLDLAKLLRCCIVSIHIDKCTGLEMQAAGCRLKDKSKTRSGKI